MTEADVRQLMKNAELRGREVSRLDALAFIGAKETLASPASSEYHKENALRVIEGFTAFIATGEKKAGFAEFVLPQFETEEEQAETLAKRERFIAFYANLASIGVTSGSDVTMADYEVGVGFRERTGLTFEQVAAMSAEQMQAYR